MFNRFNLNLLAARTPTTYRCQSRTARALCTPAILCLLLVSQYSAAQMTDIVHLKNGDRMTGEISEMTLGEMRFETRAMGFVSVKWEDIESIETNKTIQFETSTGERAFGNVSTTNNGNLDVNTRNGMRSLGLEEVVYFQRIKADRSTWDAMDKTLRLGFSFDQASDVFRWNIGAGLLHKAEKYRASIDLNSFVTNNSATQTTRRANLTAGYQRYLRDRYFWFGNGSAQTNDALGIDHRFLLTAGAGRFAWQKRSSELLIAAGLAGNREKSTGNTMSAATSETHLEGLLQMDWTYFKLHTPSSRINTALQYYPGLSDSGRHRVNMNITLRQEFIKDMFWNIELFGEYDSRPPSGAVTGTNYGVVTSLEYLW